MPRIATVAVPALASMGDATQIELFLIRIALPREGKGSRAALKGVDFFVANFVKVNDP